MTRVFMNSRLLRPTICQLRWLRQPAHRCSSQRRWLADKPESRQTEDKQSKPDGKQNASDDSDGLREWDRTINEAISQAKRELSESSKPVASKPKHDDPGKPPTESPSPPRPDYVTTLGRVLMELPHQLEGFFAHGLDGNLYSDSVRFAEPRYSGMQLNGRHQYLGMARVLRLAMAAYFSDPQVTVVRMRQVSGKDKRQEVFVRWVFEGSARHTGLIGGEPSRYEGEFRYEMDPDSGLVAVHEVTAIHPTPPTSALATSGLARWAGWLSPRGGVAVAQRACINLPSKHTQ
ncbi:hypothetical protein H4R23_003083 [Coemansia sp. Cherry 401B]|nr:hypothetical protein H4R23_003083 [Coemansia sp. Cherry 401B]